MTTRHLPQALASAAVVFFGTYGAVQAQAHTRGVSRQRLYREAERARQAVCGQRHQLHIQQLRQLQQQLANAHTQQAWTVLVDPDKQNQFAATAAALGVSLSATHTLLEVLLGERTPSRATLGRRVQHTGEQAQAVLQVLDLFSDERARQIAADEIFVGQKPVLMTVEQHSLCWLGGRLVEHRDGESWAAEYRRFAAAEQVTCDRGQGLRKGLAIVNKARRQAGVPTIAEQSDHFPPLRKAQELRHGLQLRAEAAYKKAEQLEKTYEHTFWRTGRRTAAGSLAVKRAWQRAEQAMDTWITQERLLQQLQAAVRLFTPSGELNTPARAQAEVETLLAQWDGANVDKVRRGLCAEAFTFLQRAHEQLQALPVPKELVEAAVRVEGLKSQPERLRGTAPSARARRGVLLSACVLLGLAKEAGRQAIRLVREVLSGACWSSSVVEGLNSVVRMHQSRHKRLSQALLDLKRLHWNVHAFVAGKRQGGSPYAHLGVRLPTDDWWELLKIPPEQLMDKLSDLNPPV